MDRAIDAKERLEAMHEPVPRPTRKMLEQNKKEEASRQQATLMAKGLGTFQKGPDVSKAARVGDPTMVDPEPTTATNVIRGLSQAASGGGGKMSATVVDGKITPNQEAPRSDTPAASADTAAPAPEQPAGTAAAANELKPNVPDANELTPNVEAADPSALPPLQQSNQLEGGTPTASASSASKNEDLADISSSQKKKKKGLKKLNPF
jgi:hypothetical protein